MLATVPVPRVATCQTPMKARKIATDTIAARNASETVHGQPHRVRLLLIAKLSR